MYPNLYYAFDDLFGIKLEGLRWVNSFGFFVALSFMLCAWVFSKELKRKEKQGLLTFKEEKIWIGKPASLFELCWNALLGFIVGYKLIGIVTGLSVTTSSPQEYILSDKEEKVNYPNQNNVLYAYGHTTELVILYWLLLFSVF